MQATGEPLRRNCSQYAPRELSPDATAAVLASADFASFLQCIGPRCALPAAPTQPAAIPCTGSKCMSTKVSMRPGVRHTS